MEVQDDLRSLRTGFDHAGELALLLRDETLLDEVVEIEHALPMRHSDQYDRNRANLARLHEVQRLEDFIERAVATRKRDERLRTQQKVHLAQGEVMKAERQ